MTPLVTSHRSIGRFAILLALAAAPRVAHAGGPLVFATDGTPIGWNTSQAVPYTTDLGDLGSYRHTKAVPLVDKEFAAWQNVTTATIEFARAGDLPVDVDATNFGPYLGPYGGTFTPLGQNAIVFDANGAIFDLLFGVGTGVVGFAGPTFINTASGVIPIGAGNPPGAEIVEGLAFLNGKFVDGIDDPSLGNYEVTAKQFEAVMLHEFGHFAGLDHTQIHGLISPPESDSYALTQPVETMYSFIVDDGQSTLERDDSVALSALYPTASFAATTGRIAGRVLDSSGAPLTGINVIAHNVAHAGDDVSYVSGATLAPAGSYVLVGLTPGAEYTVGVQEIDVYAREGSSVGPYSIPVTMPGPPEFYSGAAESDDPAVDPPASATPITIAAGVATSGVDIRLNRQSFAVNNGGIADPCIQRFATGDFDEDGLPDVVATRWAYIGIPTFPPNATLYLHNLGGGTFAPSTIVDAFPGGESIVAVQLNPNVDHHLDLAVASMSTGQLRIYFGDGHGGFTAPQTVLTAGGADPAIVCMRAARLNGDTIQDLFALAQDWGVGSTAYSLLGNGSGGFTVASTSFVVGSGSPTSPFLVTGDFAGGPEDDVIGLEMTADIPSPPVPPIRLALLVNDGAGGFTQTVFPMASITDRFSQYIAPGDFNGDGKLDLAFINWAPPHQITYTRSFLDILLGNGAGTFTLASESTIPEVLANMIVSDDFDGDGHADVAVGGAYFAPGDPGAKITIGFGDGNGGMREVTQIWGLSEFPDVAMVSDDFDRDGRADVLVGKASGIGGANSPPCSMLLNRIPGVLAVADPEPNRDGLWLATAPNPMSVRSNVAFHLPARARVTLELFDIAGRRACRLLDGTLTPGVHHAALERHGAGRALAAGLYLVRLRVDDVSLTRRLVITE